MLSLFQAPAEQIWRRPSGRLKSRIVRDGGKDVFVHASALQRAGIMAFDEGQRVVVDIAGRHKGPETIAVRLAEAAPERTAPRPSRA
jgi:cold shock CspA family protein